jgi:hypothetical protein
MLNKTAKIFVKRKNLFHKKLPPITKIVHRQLSRLWDKSIREGLFDLLRSGVMPQYTGMSVGSLLPLARALKSYTEARSFVHPISIPRKGYEILGNRWYPHAYRGVALGERIGARNENMKITYGNEKRMVFGFRFKIAVFQWWLHEVAPSSAHGPSSGPWYALEILLASIRLHALENWKKYMPDIASWIIDGKIFTRE